MIFRENPTEKQAKSCPFLLPLNSYISVCYLFSVFLWHKRKGMSEIAKRIENIHEGRIFFISDFSDLNGNEKVVSRALSAEEKRGNVVRLANGVYLRPKNTRFGIVYPSVDDTLPNHSPQKYKHHETTGFDWSPAASFVLCLCRSRI